MKITKRQLRRIIREELERQPMDESFAAGLFGVLLPWLMVNYIMSQSEGSAYHVSDEWWENGHFNGKMFASRRWKHFLTQVDKQFDDEAIGHLYNQTVNDPESKRLMNMMQSNRGQHSMADELEKSMPNVDRNILQRVGIKLKEYHRNYKKSMKSLNNSMPKGGI